MFVNARRLPLYLALVLLLGACAAPPASPSPSASPQPSASAQPGSTASPGGEAAAYVATIAVEEERYRILLTDPQGIENARRLLAGMEAPSIPNGLIVRGDTGVNTGYSWHIDPDSLEFVDATIEVCDGLPSHVEDGTLEGDRYCPWGARVVDLQPATD